MNVPLCWKYSTHNRVPSSVVKVVQACAIFRRTQPTRCIVRQYNCQCRINLTSLIHVTIFKEPNSPRCFAPCRGDADDIIIGPVVVGNVGNNSVSSYRLYASEAQQLIYAPIDGRGRSHTHLLASK